MLDSGHGGSDRWVGRTSESERCVIGSLMIDILLYRMNSGKTELTKTENRDMIMTRKQISHFSDFLCRVSFEFLIDF